MVSKTDQQIFNIKFEFHYAPHSYGLVPHLSLVSYNIIWPIAKDKGLVSFSQSIILKMNVIRYLDFELAFFESTLQQSYLILNEDSS